MWTEMTRKAASKLRHNDVIIEVQVFNSTFVWYDSGNNTGLKEDLPWSIF